MGTTGEGLRMDGALLYVGTYTGGQSEGIYGFRFDGQTGALTALGVTAAEQPSYLALHPSLPCLYAVNERSDGSVSAYAIEPQSGGLRLLGRAGSGGAAPCHLHVDGSGRYLFVANYGGGSAGVLALGADGALGGDGVLVDLVVHTGVGHDPGRQAGPHVHAVVPDLTNEYLLVSDLGLDQVVVYPFDKATGRLDREGAQVLQAGAGTGPRHLAWHPSGRYAYLVGELDATVITLGYAQGRLTELGRRSTLPVGTEGVCYPGEVAVHPSGRFVYVSNRGHESIAVFAVEAGGLRLVSHHGTGGVWPRHFGIDPSGRFLVAANQHSGTVVVFGIDAGSGALRATGGVYAVPEPSCVRFVG